MVLRGEEGTEGVLTLVLARMSEGHLVKKVCMQRLWTAGPRHVSIGCFYNVKLKTALPLASLSMPVCVTLHTYILQGIKNCTGWLEYGLVECSQSDMETVEQLRTVPQGVPSTSQHPPSLLCGLQGPSKLHTKPLHVHVHHFNMSWRVKMLS